MKDIDILFKELNEHTQSGDRKGTCKALKELITNRHHYYQNCQTIEHFDDFSESMLHALLLDIDEEEEESIEGAELCYAAIAQQMKALLTAGITPKAEIAKRRLLLLHYFNDYLTDAMTTLFLSNHKETQRLESRTLAIDCMEKMQLHDLYWLAENYPDSSEKDEQIAECDGELSAAIDRATIEEDIKNALIMHKALSAHLSVKYKKRG